MPTIAQPVVSMKTKRFTGQKSLHPCSGAGAEEAPAQSPQTKTTTAHCLFFPRPSSAPKLYSAPRPSKLTRHPRQRQKFVPHLRVKLPAPSWPRSTLKTSAPLPPIKMSWRTTSKAYNIPTNKSSRLHHSQFSSQYKIIQGLNSGLTYNKRLARTVTSNQLNNKSTITPLLKVTLRCRDRIHRAPSRLRCPRRSRRCWWSLPSKLNRKHLCRVGRDYKKQLIRSK